MFTVSIRYQIRRAKPGQLQYPVANPQSVPADLEPQEAVPLVTRRAREALKDQRETARRALLHQQGELLAATHHYEVAARQNLDSTLAINNETHHSKVLLQVRQLEHEADARFFPKTKGTVIAMLSGSK